MNARFIEKVTVSFVKHIHFGEGAVRIFHFIGVTIENTKSICHFWRTFLRELAIENWNFLMLWSFVLIKKQTIDCLSIVKIYGML